MYVDKSSSIAYGLNSDFTPTRHKSEFESFPWCSTGGRCLVQRFKVEIKPSGCDVYAPPGRVINLSVIFF